MRNIYFTVIVPVYNEEQYLRKCVDSILRQNFEDFELILVDDGSTDNSGAICDAYARKDDRVQVIHKPNGGVSSARNAGLQRVMGKYVVFCDGDDSLKENYLEEMFLLTQKPGVDLAVCGFESVNENGNLVQGRRSVDCALESSVQMLDHDLFWELFAGKRIGSCCDKAFRVDLIRRDRLEFPQNIPFAEDTDFVLRYLGAAGTGCIVAVTNKRLYLYLTQEHGSAVQKLDTDRWQMFERLFPPLEQYVSAKEHEEALRSYICAAVRFVIDGLFRYEGTVPYAQFRKSTENMLQSKYFLDAVNSWQMTEYSGLLVSVLKCKSVALMWCFYLMWKAKGVLLGK